MGVASPIMSRNPLKSGQCFLHVKKKAVNKMAGFEKVAIPSNRVNVSYLFCWLVYGQPNNKRGRNPLKSGQCFLPTKWGDIWLNSYGSRNPLKSGQCFLLQL